jgi:hypothetical protein
MAESEAAIVNAGFIYVGHTQFIDDLRDEDDDSDERAIAAVVYDDTRDELLRAAPWADATSRVRPAALDETTLALGEVPGGWTYAFAYPAGCVRIRGIYAGNRNPRSEAEKTRYVIEYDSTLQAKVILTDEPNPEIVFTTNFRPTTDAGDVSQFQSDFVDALAWKLAIKFAAGLRKDEATVKLAAQGYQTALGVAAANGAIESIGDAQPDPSWIAGR